MYVHVHMSCMYVNSCILVCTYTCHVYLPVGTFCVPVEDTTDTDTRATGTRHILYVCVRVVHTWVPGYIHPCIYLHLYGTSTGYRYTVYVYYEARRAQK